MRSSITSDAAVGKGLGTWTGALGEALSTDRATGSFLVWSSGLQGVSFHGAATALQLNAAESENASRQIRDMVVPFDLAVAAGLRQPDPGAPLPSSRTSAISRSYQLSI